MKHNKQFWIPLASVFCLMATNLSVHADNYTPLQIISMFHGTADRGFDFTTEISTDANSLRYLIFENRGADQVDIRAYSGNLGGTNEDGKNYFVTFLYPQGTEQTFVGSAKLNYAVLSFPNNEIKTYYLSGESAIILPLGIACLYSQFVNGTFGSTPSEFYANEFRDAISFLDQNTLSDSAISWTNNRYLNYLMGITTALGLSMQAGADFWLADYNLRQNYIYNGTDIMGDNYVFVLGVTEVDGSVGSSMLYAARKSIPEEPPGTPEPATLLLWTLGGLGLAGTSWLGKRRKNLTLV